MRNPLSGIITVSLLSFATTTADAQKLGEESYGIASYYADFFYDKPTSTGEILKRNQYTAAHMTLPFGTMIEVTNLSNKRFVIVRITDRGPYKKGRIIDLTENPAKWLRITDNGLSKVKLKVLGFDGDIMLEPYDSLSFVSPPRLERKFYQKPIIRYRKVYRLKKNWRKRKYPHFKKRRFQVNSYLRRIQREGKVIKIYPNMAKKGK